jgi:hypothetical protein
MAHAIWEVEPNRWLRFLTGSIVLKIHVSNDEVNAVADAASPTAALSSLMVAACGAAGPVGPGIAAVIASSAYLLKRMNKKYGEKGLIISLKLGGIGALSTLTSLRLLPPPNN